MATNHSDPFCKDRWRSKVSRLRSRFSTPSLSLFDDNLTESLIQKTESLSLSLPSAQNTDKIRERVKSFGSDKEKIRERVKSIGSDFKRIRSKSCERVFQRCRKGLDRVVRKEEQQAVVPFQHSATLRQSRRTRTRKARPRKRTYASYARAVADVNPSPYDTDALTLRVGDMIGIISQHPSGIWTGESEGKVGRFKFINVEIVETGMGTEWRGSVSEEGGSVTSVTSLSDLLATLELAHLTSKLVLNGYDKLESLDSVTRADLEYLGIRDAEEQTKILQAAVSLSNGDIKIEDSSDRQDSGCFDCGSGSGDEDPASGSEGVERRHLAVSRRTKYHSSLPASDSWSHYMNNDVVF